MSYPTARLRLRVRSQRIATRFANLLSQTRQTISEEFPTLIVLAFIAGVLLLLRYAHNRGTNETNNLFEGLLVEVAGTLILFVVLNRSIKSIAGIGVHERLPIEAFIDAASEASREVAILETFTDLVNSGRHQDKFKIAIQQALSRGAKVRVLLVLPESNSARERAIQLKETDVKQQIELTVARFFAITQDLAKADLEVRLYDSPLFAALHRWDDRSYVSFFPVDQRSDHVPNLEVAVNTPLGRSVLEQFELLWKPEKSVSIKDYMELVLRLTNAERSQDYRLAFYKANEDVYYVRNPKDPTFVQYLSDGATVSVSVGPIQFDARCKYVNPNDEDRSQVTDWLLARYAREKDWLTNESIVRLDKIRQEPTK